MGLPLPYPPAAWETAFVPLIVLDFPERVAKRSPKDTKGTPRDAEKRQASAKGMSRGAKWEPNGGQENAKPKGCQSEPKGAPRRANLSPRWEPWATLRRPWGGMATIPKIIEKRARGICFSGSKMDQILEPPASHFQ